MEQKFYTHWDRPEKKYEYNSGRLMVETAGYIPAQKRIENLILAGQRLIQSRSEAYDFQAGKENPEDFDYVDVTRSKNFDPVDADHVADYLKVKGKEGKEKIIKKAKEKEVDKEDVDGVIEEIETEKK